MSARGQVKIPWELTTRCQGSFVLAGSFANTLPTQRAFPEYPDIKARSPKEIT